MGVYNELGVKTYINALDTVSIYGGSRMHPFVLDAMESASKNFVELSVLQEKIGERIAQMTDNQAAYISSGASAGMLMCAAVCMAGDNVDRLKQLPDTSGMKNEILMMEGQRTGYERALQVAGGKIAYVDTGKAGVDTLRKAVNENTAAIFFFDLLGSREKSLSFEDTVQVAREFNLPLIVDAAAQLPPKENLWYFTQNGADAACFSGGKGLRGPQSGGLVLGKQWLIDGIKKIAPPIHGIARSSKIGREEIAGVYAALKLFLEPGFEEQRVQLIEARGAYIRKRLEESGLFSCKRQYPGPTGQSYAYVYALPKKGIGQQALIDALKAGKPGVLVGRRGDDLISVNPLNLNDDETDIVIRQIIEQAEKLINKEGPSI